MQNFEATSIRYVNQVLELLDQRLLPQQQSWVPCRDVETLVGMIQRLQVRGAPLIGLSAVLLLAYLAEQGWEESALREAATRLRAARPTAVNLMNNLDAVVATLPQGTEVVVARAEALFAEDRTLCDRMSERGAALLPQGARVLTHCNTGGLATAGGGTAIGVIRRAHQDGKIEKVWVGETRPLLQGGRLTSWEMAQANIPYQLITDSMAAWLMQKGEVDAIVVGADRIAANGDFANKIGTYGLAVSAHYHKVPFYVVSPTTTVDPACPDGDNIPIEVRAPEEVRGVSCEAGTVIWAPEDASAFNPAFDVTPAALVTAWVLDTGVYDAASFCQAVTGYSK
jgi:methylthioribose-1-phosphate isomerase